MTEYDRAYALKWLDQFTATAGWAYQVRTIKAMLAEPRMPAEPPPEALRSITVAIWGGRMNGCSQDATDIASEAYRALYAHLSAPKPPTKKMIRIRGPNGFSVLLEPPISQSEEEVPA